MLLRMPLHQPRLCRGSRPSLCRSPLLLRSAPPPSPVRCPTMAPSWIRVDGRHGAWVHPLATMLVLFGVIIGLTILTHDFITSASPHFGTAQGDMFEKGAPPTNFQPWVAYFFAAYITAMIGSRYLDCGSYIFYELSLIHI